MKKRFFFRTFLLYTLCALHMKAEMKQSTGLVARFIFIYLLYFFFVRSFILSFFLSYYFVRTFKTHHTMSHQHYILLYVFLIFSSYKYIYICVRLY